MKSRIQSLILTAVFTGIIILCSWLQIPAPIPFTLQTLGIYLCLAVLGGKNATLSVAVYIALGAMGLPVFSGFTGGVGALFGATGGFVWGFLFIPLSGWCLEKTPLKKNSLVFGAIFGTIICYICGMLWYSMVYMKGALGFAAAFLSSVLPFVIPDAVKLAVAVIISGRLKNIMEAYKK